MQKYDSYKDSGVEWIGKIPQDWDVCRLKSYCTLKGRIGWNGLRSEEFKELSYAYLVTGQDFNSASIQWDKCYQIDKERYDEDPFIQLSEGDLLITKDGTIGKIAKVSNLDKPACLNSGIFVMKQRKQMYSQGFLYWLLCSNMLKDFNAYTSSGTTILHLYQNVFERMPMIVPSIEEQNAIANYLDNKCSKIDNVIATQEKRVELLRELKQSIITRAVTRGINPNAKLKDSGVEWIGEIPEHWEVMRLNELGKYKKGPFGSALKVTMFVKKGTDTVKVYQQQNAINKDWQLGDDYIEGSYYREAMKGFTVEANDIIVSCAGTIGECYIVPDNAEKGIINQALMKMKMDRRKVNLDYFLLLFDIMLKEESAKSSNGSAMKNIPPFDVMKKMLIPLPSLEEQSTILKRLSEKIRTLDSSISKAYRQIELLKEYKQSLITEVVTGKRKVV